MSRSPHAEQAELRAAVLAVSREVVRLPSLDSSDSGATRTDGVLQAWETLLGVLAFEPEPELRECPFCQQLIMRGATRCRDCWRRVEPLSPTRP